jgi:hypothetical protein
MAIERDIDGITFTCDDAHCHEFIDTGTDDFAEAIEEAKGEGWKIRNVNGVWMHFCPDEDLDGLEL